MKPVKTLMNQFRGINPHLHSYWQETGEWIPFFAAHINDVARELNKHLPSMGYMAALEQSIQVWKPGGNSLYEEAAGNAAPRSSG